jgi:hypothetical protein
MTDIAVTVNGQQRPLAGTPAHATALDWLRDNGLSGSKEGCAEGECGACAMLLATPTADGGTAWTPVNACLVPVYALDGQEFITAEGSDPPTTCTPSRRSSPRRRIPVRLLHPGLRLQHGGRVLPGRPHARGRRPRRR